MLSDFGVCPMGFSQNWSTPFHRWFFSWDQTRTCIIFSCSPIVKKLPYPIRILVYPGKIDNKGVSRKNCGWTWGQGGCSKNLTCLKLWEQAKPQVVSRICTMTICGNPSWLYQFVSFSTLPRMIESITYGQLWKADECRPFFKNKQCTCFQLVVRWSFDLCIRNYRARRIRFLGHAHGVGWHWIVIYIPRQLSFPSTSLGCE